MQKRTALKLTLVPFVFISFGASSCDPKPDNPYENAERPNSYDDNAYSGVNDAPESPEQNFEAERAEPPRKHISAKEKPYPPDEPVLSKKSHRGQKLPKCMYMSAKECEVFHLTNIYRIDNGRKPLLPSPSCSAIAQDRANQFAKAGVDSRGHVTRSGEMPDNTARRLRKERGIGKLGENLSPNYSGRVSMEKWKKSPGHNENLLDPDYKYYAVGWAKNRHFRKHDTSFTSEAAAYSSFWIQCFHSDKNWKTQKNSPESRLTKTRTTRLRHPASQAKESVN